VGQQARALAAIVSALIDQRTVHPDGQHPRLSIERCGYPVTAGVAAGKGEDNETA
jgi:hypothetical protein